MTVRPIDQLGSLGPDAEARRWSAVEARDYVRNLTVRSDENFHVLSRFVPTEAVADFAAVYAFCRWADDLADETHRVIVDPKDREAARAEALRLLGWWRSELKSCFDGEARHPVFVALAETADRRGLPSEPFHDLIDAFEQDQRVTRYATWEELIGYCRRSANPVGRLVLGLAGCADESRVALSDDVCTGLQLVNLWQDVRRDLVERDRVYLPTAETGFDAEDLAKWLERPGDPGVRVPYIRAVRSLLERTSPLFDSADRLIPSVPAAYRGAIWLFAAGGRAVANKIERAGCTTLWSRPRLSKSDKVMLLGRAWFESRRAVRNARVRRVSLDSP